MIYHNQNGLLKPIKRRPFVVQLNRPHRSTPGPCLTKKRGSGYRTCNKNKKCPFFACMCVGFWPACAHFFLVRRALWLGHACTLNGQCALFLFSVRAIFYFLCARFYWAMRAIFSGPCALFFSVRAIYFPNCSLVHIAVRAIWLFLGV